MTGSLHEKNGKWQIVFYGSAAVLFPDKKTYKPDKKVCMPTQPKPEHHKEL